MKKRQMRGFTLVELSIVLIIIGLVASGVLVGREMIRAAELRKIHRQYEEFTAAAQTFRSKYNCLPGDCAQATEFFGAHPACPSLSAATLAAPAAFKNDTPGTPTCNGDGDGRLDAGITFYETTTFWQHLAGAGLIGGSYTGGWPTAGGWAWIGGINTPVGLSADSHWMVFDSDPQAVLMRLVDTWATIVPGGFGTMYKIVPGNNTTQPFSPAEAQSFDSKYDDGSPVAGQIMVSYGLQGCTSAANEAASDESNRGARYLSGATNIKDQKNCNLIYHAGL